VDALAPGEGRRVVPRRICTMSGSAFVLAAILVIWLGIFLYLVSVERKLNRLARKVDRNES
jgi:CcmD family protein